MTGGLRETLRMGMPAVLLFLVACVASRPQGASRDAEEAWRRVSARIAADPGDGLATLEAARLALFVRNDADGAERLAAEAARAPALEADANLFRTYLAWRRRDYAAVLDRVQLTVGPDTHHERAEIALWMLEWISRDHPDFADRVGPWLSELIERRGGAPGFRRVAARILLKLRGVAKDIDGYDRVMREQVGALTRVRTACPFGLFPEVAWGREQPPDRDQGPLVGPYLVEGPSRRARVEVRERQYRDGWLRCDDWPDGGGVGFHEAYVETEGTTDAILTVYAGGNWRVDVDRTAILSREGLTAELPRLAIRRIRLSPGWHRIRMRMATGGDSHDAWITLTDLGGRPLGRRLPLGHLPPPIGTTTALSGSEDDAIDRLLAKAGDSPARTLGAELERLNYAAYLLQTYPYDDPLKARVAAERLLELAPSSADGMYALGEAIEADDSVPMKQRRSRSRSLQRKLVEVAPDHLLGRYALGFSAQQEDRPEAALEHYDRAIAINPAYYWGHYRRFEVLRDLGWNREARKALKRALSLAANPTLLREAAQWFDGRHAIARRDALNDELEKRLSSLAPRLTANRARRRGDMPAAAAAWLRRADVHPWRATPWKNLYEISFNAGPGEAGPLAKWAKAKPYDPGLPAKRAELAALQGRTDEAVQALEAGLADHPERLKDRLLLALLTNQAIAATPPETSELRAAYDQAIREDPKLASWPNHEAVYLLDRRIDRLWADGGGIRETHRVTLLQNKAAIDEAGDWRPPSGARLLEMRTLKADGTVLEPELGQGKGDLSFSGLVPGDVIEIRYLQPIEPDIPGGGSHDRYYMQFNSRPIWRGELDVWIPQGERLQVLRRAGAAGPTETTEAGRRRYSWRILAVSPLDSEPYQAPFQEWLPHVEYAYKTVSVEARRRDQLLARLLRGTRRTPAVVDQAKEVIRGIDSDHARASALFRWVRDNIDTSGRQARLLGLAAPGILATRRGNRTLLLSSMLTAVGIDHEVLVARPVDEPATDPPSPSLFRYSSPIIRLAPDASSDGGPLLLSTDGDHAPVGWLPEDLWGAEALLIADGSVRVERLPKVGGELWTVDADLKLSVAKAVLSGRVVIVGSGESTADLRRLLPKIPKAQRRQVVERALAPALPGLVLNSFEVSDLEDVDTPIRMVLSIEIRDALARTTEGLRLGRLFSVPVSSLLGRGLSPGKYLQRAERKQTLMTRPLRERLVVRIELDQAVAIKRSPPSIATSAPWGTLGQRWESDSPTQIRLTRNLDIGIRRVPVEQHAEFADAMGTLDRALSAEVLLTVTP